HTSLSRDWSSDVRSSDLFHYGFYPVAGTGKRCRGELLLQGQQAAELPGKTVEIRTYNPKKRYRLRWVAQGSLFHVRQTVRINFRLFPHGLVSSLLILDKPCFFRRRVKQA